MSLSSSWCPTNSALGPLARVAPSLWSLGGMSACHWLPGGSIARYRLGRGITQHTGTLTLSLLLGPLCGHKMSQATVPCSLSQGHGDRLPSSAFLQIPLLPTNLDSRLPICTVGFRPVSCTAYQKFGRRMAPSIGSLKAELFPDAVS